MIFDRIPSMLKKVQIIFITFIRLLLFYALRRWVYAYVIDKSQCLSISVPHGCSTPIKNANIFPVCFAFHAVLVNTTVLVAISAWMNSALFLFDRSSYWIRSTRLDQTGNQTKPDLEVKLISVMFRLNLIIEVHPLTGDRVGKLITTKR